MKKQSVTPTAWPGEGPAPGDHDVAVVDARGHDRAIVERLLGGEVRLVDEQEVGNVMGGLALLALVRPPQSVRDCSSDFIPSRILSQMLLDEMFT